MPNIDENLAFTPAAELRELIGEKQVSPVELTALYYERIDRLDSQLHAYLTLCRDEAMQAARDAENAVMRGDDLGALHGVPISIKDLEMSKGVRSTSGSLPFTDRIPEEDSVVIERVKAAGAIILGKTNTPEFGHRGTTENLLGEPCRNPWNTERTPGGSSGGAAAGVAAGLSAISTGSDGGGSIRIPASFCGLYGIKPTQGESTSLCGTECAYHRQSAGTIGTDHADRAGFRDSAARAGWARCEGSGVFTEYSRRLPCCTGPRHKWTARGVESRFRIRGS